MGEGVGATRRRDCSLAQLICPHTSDPTKRLVPGSAGSGAPAGSEVDILPDFEAPVSTEAPACAEASGETRA